MDGTRVRSALRLTPLRRDVGLMIAVFAILRVYAVAGVDAVRFSDSGSYFQVDLLGGSSRLWTVPLFYELLPSDPARVIGQAVVGVLCWGTLAAVVASLPQSPVLGRIGAAGILLLALTDPIAAWDLAILSESLATSLAALVVAALLLAVRQRDGRTLAFLAGAVTLWAFTRHINLLLVGLLLPVALVFAARRFGRRTAVGAACVVIVLASWATVTFVREDTIWRWNSWNIVTKRVLPDAEARAYFQERGLQITPQMRDGFDSLAEYRAVYDEPATQEFLREHWRGAYAGWLARHPVDVVRKPLDDLSVALATEPGLYGQPRSVLPGPLHNVGFLPKVDNALLAIALVAVFWLAVWWRRRGATAVDAAAAALVALSVAWFVLTWHTTVELSRPAVPIAAMLRVGLLLLVLMSADRVVAAWRSGSHELVRDHAGDGEGGRGSRGRRVAHVERSLGA